MEEEIALVTSGLYCGDPSGYSSLRAKQIRARPNDWVPLLQIASDEAANMMSGDLGRLYLWIKKADLKAQNFNTTWLTLQCS